MRPGGIMPGLTKPRGERPGGSGVIDIPLEASTDEEEDEDEDEDEEEEGEEG